MNSPLHIIDEATIQTVSGGAPKKVKGIPLAEKKHGPSVVVVSEN